MCSIEKPSFYLYGIGHSPDRLTLGTLVYKDYTRPDLRYAPFPKLSEQDLNNTDLVTSQPISGSFTNSSNRKYGFGIDALELATISVEFTRQKSKIVTAKRGRRVTLNQPEEFFADQVLPNSVIRRHLGIWLTCATSAWVCRMATFRKPRIYCVTGYYELTDACAKIFDSKEIGVEVGASSTLIGAATGAPIGATLGPFADGETMKADVSMPGAAIWAARFQQVNVDYLKMSAKGDTPLPVNTIKLYRDITDPGKGVRGRKAGTDVLTATVGAPELQHLGLPQKPEEQENIRSANVVAVGFEKTEELSENDDAESDAAYWEAFNEAEGFIIQAQNTQTRKAAAKAAMEGRLNVS